MEEPQQKPQQQEEVPTRVECPAAKDPAVRLFIGAAMGLALAAYCFVDHYVLGDYQRPGPDGDINDWIGYLFNAYGPFVFGPPGLVLVVWGIVFLRRKLVADQDGIGYVGKHKLAWSDVKRLDTSKFEKKGILRLEYGKDGEERVLTLDGWKLQNFKPLVRLVESKLKTE